MVDALTNPDPATLSPTDPGAAEQRSTISPGRPASAPGSGDDASYRETRVKALGRWQRRLLPLMSGMLVLLAVFYVGESVMQMRALQGHIRQMPVLDLGALPQAARLSAETQARFALEAHALDQRERLANYMLVSRTWTRYMAFTTGMVLALVGAAFVLGKLREPTSTLGADAATVKVSLATSSPGLVLAALGTILMLSASVVTFDVAGEWNSVYFPADEGTQDLTGEPPLPEGAAGQRAPAPVDTPSVVRDRLPLRKQVP